jgi:hypothetical protein
MYVDTILAGIAILLLAVSVLIQLSITALRGIAPQRLDADASRSSRG